MIDEKTNWFTYNVINDCDVIDSHLGDDTIDITPNSIIAYIVEKYGIETEVIIANHEVEGCLVYLGSCSLGRIYTTIPTTRYTTLEYHLSAEPKNPVSENVMAFSFRAGIGNAIAFPSKANNHLYYLDK